MFGFLRHNNTCSSKCRSRGEVFWRLALLCWYWQWCAILGCCMLRERDPVCLSWLVLFDWWWCCPLLWCITVECWLLRRHHHHRCCCCCCCDVMWWCRVMYLSASRVNHARQFAKTHDARRGTTVYICISIIAGLSVLYVRAFVCSQRPPWWPFRLAETFWKLLLSRASNVAARPSAPGEFNGIIARLLSQFRDDSCDLLITNKHC